MTSVKVYYNDIWLNESFILLQDDYLFDIKDKIFAYSEQKLILLPEYIALYTKSGNDKNYLLGNQLLLNATDSDKIYVENLVDYIYNNYSDVTMLYVDENSIETTVLPDVIKIWESIDLDSLKMIVYLLLVRNNSENYKELTTQIRDFFAEQMIRREKFRIKFNKLYVNLKDFYNNLNGVEIRDLFPDENFNINQLTASIGDIYANKNIQQIDLFEIFKQFELDSDVVFMIISSTIANSENPLLKVYNDLISEDQSSITVRDFKFWFLNEKKKVNIIKFKKVKGLLFKVFLGKTSLGKNNYFTVNLLPNGSMIIKLDFNEEELITYEQALHYIQRVDILIEKLNLLNTAFKRAFRIPIYDPRELRIIDLDTNSFTNIRLDKGKIASVVSQDIYNSYFEFKDLVGKEIISFYYKKLSRDFNLDDELDSKGITVNIKDNPSIMDSSRIIIYGASTVNHIKQILKYIYVLNKISEEEGVEELFSPEPQKLKNKTNLRALKDQGVVTDSKNCQKERQPIISNEIDPRKALSKHTENGYELKFDSKRYICPNEPFIYVGFTNNDIPCCFKRDQRQKPTWTRNMEGDSVNQYLSPSNLKIDLKYKGEKITVIPFREELDDEIKFYFLDEMNSLFQIIEPKVLKTLGTKPENTWLEPVPLTQLTTIPSKTKCNNPPKLSEKEIADINKVCTINFKKFKYFGYNSTGFPCCFETEPTFKSKNKRKNAINAINTQHVIITDKILNLNQVGNLPTSLDKLLNPNDTLFYRVGVLQNKSSFLNVILSALDNKINKKIVNSSSALRNECLKFLQKNNLFTSLNNGQLLNSFTEDQYKEVLIDTNAFLSHTLFTDLLSRITKHNILIFDITNTDNITLACGSSKYQTEINSDLPFLFFLKHNLAYELVVKIEEDQVQKVFTKDDKITKLIINFYKDACSTIDSYPDNYKFKVLFDANDVIKKLENTECKIVEQYINTFDKVLYLKTKNNFIIPIYNTSKFDDLSTSNNPEYFFIKPQKLIDGFDKISEYLKPKIKVVGKVVKNEEIIALNLNCGITIPVKPVKDTKDFKYPTLESNYYLDVDDKLKYDIDSNSDNRKKWLQKYIALHDLVFKVKYELANYIETSEELRTELVAIIFEKMVSRNDKYLKLEKIVKNIFKEIIIFTSDIQLKDFYDKSAELTEKKTCIKLKNCKENTLCKWDHDKCKFQVPKGMYSYLMGYIINELLTDTIDKNILNNYVRPTLLNQNDIIRRSSESIMFNIKDISNFIKRTNQVDN